MKKTLLVISALAVALVLILTTVLPASANSTASGRLIPEPTYSYVSGMGSYSFQVQSDNTVLVNLNIKKLTPGQTYEVWMTCEPNTPLGQGFLLVGNPIADSNGSLTYTGFIYDPDLGYPTGFPTDSPDFNVFVTTGDLYTSNTSGYYDYHPDVISLETGTVTLTLN